MWALKAIELLAVGGTSQARTITLENWQDQVAFIISANIQRRHLSKGQQAMAIAKTLLVSGKTQEEAAEMVGLSQQRKSQVNTVLRHLPDLANEVLVGATSLDVAYGKAKDFKKAMEDKECQIVRVRIQSPRFCSGSRTKTRHFWEHAGGGNSKDIDKLFTTKLRESAELGRHPGGSFLGEMEKTTAFEDFDLF